MTILLGYRLNLLPIFFKLQFYIGRYCYSALIILLLIRLSID